MNLSNTYTTSLLAAAAVAAASSALASEPLAAKNQAKPAERLGQVVRRLAKAGKGGEDRSTEPEPEEPQDRDCGLLEGDWVATENITSVTYSDSDSLFEGGIQFITSKYFGLELNLTREGNTLTGRSFFPDSTGTFIPVVGFHRSDCSFRLVSVESPMVFEGLINDDDFGTSLYIEASGSGPQGTMAYSGMLGRGNSDRRCCPPCPCYFGCPC